MSLKRTPLYNEHKRLQARMVPFAGWEMPVQYSSIIDEHLTVRMQVGIFDVSHMGEIIVKGKDSIKFLDKLTPNLIEDQKVYQVRYNAILNHKGGIKDDVTIFRESEESFFIIVNASNIDKIYNYFISENHYKNLDIYNVSDAYSMIAVQGPEAEEKTIEIFKNYATLIQDLKYYHFIDIDFEGEKIRISRTGYTGEDGYEIITSPTLGLKIWNIFIKNGVKPCGLGARDSLRLEALYPLYGHELNEERTPVESGIGWIVRDKEINYYGKEHLLHQKKYGPEYIIIPFIMSEKSIPREHYKVYDNHREIGTVQSGLFSPSLKIGIGTAFLPIDYKKNEKEIYIEIRDKKIKAKTYSGAFIKGTAGRKR